MRYREAIESPKCSLKIYTAPLTSISYDFMTYLSITTPFSVPDLVKLSEVPNLGVLEIMNTSEMGPRLVDDRLIRAWSIAATTEGAFSVLRILRLWNFEGVTGHSLALVNKFPSLGVYDVRGCGFSGAAPVNTRQLGWEVQVDINILHVLASACSLERTRRLTKEHWLDTHKVYNATMEQPWDGAKIHKIRREDVDAFLVKTCNEELDPPEQEQYTGNATHRFANADPQARPGKTTSRPSKHPDELFYGVDKKERTWDDHLSSAYAQLGELRSDKDISSRGIDIGDQAIVRGQLVNSIPLVFLRLGKHLPELQLESRPGFNTLHLCFFRLKIPPVTEQDKKERGTTDDRTSKRKGSSGVVENKKMKLGDVLGSFM